MSTARAARAPIVNAQYRDPAARQVVSKHQERLVAGNRLVTVLRARSRDQQQGRKPTSAGRDRSVPAIGIVRPDSLGHQGLAVRVRRMHRLRAPQLRCAVDLGQGDRDRPKSRASQPHAFDRSSVIGQPAFNRRDIALTSNCSRRSTNTKFSAGMFQPSCSGMSIVPCGVPLSFTEIFTTRVTVSPGDAQRALPYAGKRVPIEVLRSCRATYHRTVRGFPGGRRCRAAANRPTAGEQDGNARPSPTTMEATAEGLSPNHARNVINSVSNVNYFIHSGGGL